jgi:NAD(P)-dependent dehydrogenase (short-subunit alcohol dehydrogenase family)
MPRKLAVVTGATGGIGEIITAYLVASDYHVIAIGRNQEKLRAMEMTTRAITAVSIDLSGSTRNSIAAALDHALQPSYYRTDLLVCAHGASPCKKPTLELDYAEDAAPILATDVTGTFNICQVIGAYMVAQQSGSIVLVSSAHSSQSYPARVPYAIAKSSVVAMARALAVEWGRHGVRVNSISPWQVSGERSDAVSREEKRLTGESAIELYKKKSPLMRLVDPVDIARSVLYLAENNSTTGTDLRIDCGVSASMWHRNFEGE